MKAKKLLFILALALAAGCVPQSQYNQEVQQNQQLSYLNDTYQQLNQALESEVAANQVQIQQLQDELQVTLVNEILFPEGGWELSSQGRQELSKIVPALQQVPGKYIVIQGFTDNLPILEPLAGRFPTNWDLAAGRAISVVRYLAEQGLDPNQLSAVSFGQYHPVADNSTPAGTRPEPPHKYKYSGRDALGRVSGLVKSSFFNSLLRKRPCSGWLRPDESVMEDFAFFFVRLRYIKYKSP